MNQYPNINSDGADGEYRRNGINERTNMTDSEVHQEQNENNSPATQHTQHNQPTHADGYTKIPPNESRRSKTQRIAQQEEEAWNRWKEENRPGPVHLPPERLGGAVSLADARQKQQVEARQSKLLKKLKKEEMDRKKKEVEEEEYEKMKAIQREKAKKLEMKRKKEDERRQELYQHDQQTRREKFFQKIERPSSTVSMAASSSIPASSWAKSHEYRESRKAENNADLQKMKEEQRRKAELLEEKQAQEEEDEKRRIEVDRRRVNSAFLDRLEASGSGRVSEPVPQTLKSSDVWMSDEPQEPALSTEPSPSHVHTDSAEEDDCDHMWTVMKLLNDFPYYERDMLEDITIQCKGNYKKAYELLNC